MSRRASLALVLVAFVASPSSESSAQTLEYGPLLARGVDPDTLYLKWGFDASSPATLHWRKLGASTFETLSSPDAVDHELKLYGLPLDSQFEYYVTYGAAQTATRSFSSCPTPGLPLDVVVLGDSRDGTTHAPAIMQRVNDEDPDLILETGDIAPAGTYAQYLTQFVAIAADVVDHIPFMAAPGNHDYGSSLASNYARIFATPRDASESWRAYYSFNCGNVRFIGLDSNTLSSQAQLDFLTNELDSAKLDAQIAHVFVYFHHSPYSTGTHGDNVNVQNKWVGLFESADSKVRFVFTGHDHIYARLGNGTDIQYVITGGAGAPKYAATGTTVASTTFASVSAYHYVKLHIVGGLIEGVAIAEDGTTLDTFSVGMATPPPDLMPPVFDLARPDLAVTMSGEDLAAPIDAQAATSEDLPAADLTATPPMPKLASGCNATDTEPSLVALLLVLLAFVAVSSRGAARWAACRRR